MNATSIAPRPMPSQIRDRVPARTNEAILELALAICKAQAQLRGEPTPIVFLLSQAERDALVDDAMMAVRRRDPAAYAVALHRATTPLVITTDAQKLHDVTVMRYAVETFEANLKGLRQ